MTSIQHAPSTDRGLWRRRHPAVRVLAAVLAAAWVGAVFLAGLFLTVASPAFGWLYAALCFLPGLVGVARLGGIRRWLHTVVLAGALSLVLGSLMYLQAPPDHGRIAAAATDAGLPVAGWELVDSGESGNTWCWKGCPEVVQLYAVDTTPAGAVEMLDAVLEEQGWTGGEAAPRPGADTTSEYYPLAQGAWHEGRWRMSLRVPPPAARHGWSEEAAARGLTPVEVTVYASR
jgi:hypothetical protein